MSPFIRGIGGAGLGGGVRVIVKTDFRGIYRSFDKLKRKLSDMREPLKRSAVDYMAKSVIRNRFDAGGIPRWREHALATIQRHGAHRLLYLSGRLYESATGGAGFAIVYGKTRGRGYGNVATFGSTVEYAGIHDQPRGTFTPVGMGALVPGRPWSQVTQGNINYIRDITMIWTQNKMIESGFKRR